jgi:hypothetical protein
VVIRGTVALLVLFGALASAAPVAAAPKLDFLAFTARSGSMSEQVSFQGDGGPECARAGVCGYSGTISYGFPAIRDGDGSVLISRSGRRSNAFGYTSLDVGALTIATVNGPGGGQPCTEKVLHRFDYVLMEGNASKLEVLFHPADFSPDFLDSYCVGPSDADVAHAGAIPSLSISTNDLRKHKLTLTTSSVKQFHSGPFTGTVTFNVSLVLSRTRVPSDLVNLTG